MKITTKDDIEVPIDFVFSQVTDFASLERQALRRGADVKRLDTLAEPGVGSSWHIMFPYRGKEREVNAEVVALDRPNGMTIKASSAGLNSTVQVDLVALSRSQTRLALTVNLEPTNLTARLLVQSLKLAKGSVTTRLQNRVTSFSSDIAERYRRRAAAKAGKPA